MLAAASERFLRGELSIDVFRDYLSKYFYVEELGQVAGEFTPHAEMSIPLLSRLTELEPENATAKADLGYLYWLDGDDSSARLEADKALTIEPNKIAALLLMAAVTTALCRFLPSSLRPGS